MSTILIRVGDIFKLPMCTCYMLYMYINIYIDKETHRFRLNLLKKKKKMSTEKTNPYPYKHIYIYVKKRRTKKEKKRCDMILLLKYTQYYIASPMSINDVTKHFTIIYFCVSLLNKQ